MAVLTPVDLGDARAIGQRFGLHVASVRGLLAGSVNSNFELVLGDGARVFLRVYEEQTLATAAHEAALLEHLAAHGVPTPRPLGRGDGGFIAEHRGKPAALFPFLAGGTLCQARVTPSATQAVGAALARVHLAGSTFEGPLVDRFTTAALLTRIESARCVASDGEQTAALTRLGAALERDGAAVQASKPTVIHGDLFRDNVLFQDDALVALLDFESASHGSAALDLMVTLLAWCFGDGFDAALASSLMRGYERIRLLSSDERAQLYPAARWAATRFAITRITDFEQRPRGSGVYKDYRRFIARLDALEAMDERGLATLLDG
jgi:homoserine kinase type II